MLTSPSMGLGIQPAVARLLFPFSSFAAKALPQHRRQLIVLTYHRLGTREQIWPECVQLSEATQEQFEQQMRWLRAHCTPVALEDAREIVFGRAPCPRRAVLVTFDDAYRDALDRAIPVLRETGIRPTVFLATDYIGNRKRFWWDRVAICIQSTARWRLTTDEAGGLDLPLDAPEDREAAVDLINDDLARKMSFAERDAFIEHLEQLLELPDTREAERQVVLSWDEVRELRSIFDFGAHTLTHAELSKLSTEDARREIGECKGRIERELGAPCESFAIPYGTPEAYTEESLDLCVEAGYELVFSLRSEILPPELRRSAAVVNRFGFTQRDGVAGMAAKIAWPAIFVPDHAAEISQRLFG